MPTVDPTSLNICTFLNLYGCYMCKAAEVYKLFDVVGVSLCRLRLVHRRYLRIDDGQLTED